MVYSLPDISNSFNVIRRRLTSTLHRVLLPPLNVCRYRFENISDLPGSKEHYFHFLLGYLLPALAHARKVRPGSTLCFDDCGPVMAPLLPQACALAGFGWIPSTEKHVRWETNVDRWDLSFFSGDAFCDPSPDMQRVSYPLISICQHLKRVAFLNVPNSVPEDRIIIMQRSPSHPYYNRGGQAEIPGYGTGRREILNIQHIVDMIKTAGYPVQLVEPGGLSFAEQIRLFAKARLVIGIRGAEFANLVWMRPRSSALMLCEPILQENHAASSLAEMFNVSFSTLPVAAARCTVDPQLVLDWVRKQSTVA